MTVDEMRKEAEFYENNHDLPVGILKQYYLMAAVFNVGAEICERLESISAGLDGVEEATHRVERFG